MGARGSTASSEAADAVLTVDHLARLRDVAALARRTRRIALQSVLAGMGMSLAAMAVAAVGLLPAVWPALLQEAIDVAVILNALRALRPSAPDVRVTPAYTALTRRFRTEHQAIRADIDQLRATADALGSPGAMTRVRARSRTPGPRPRTPSPPAPARAARAAEPPRTSASLRSRPRTR